MNIAIDADSNGLELKRIICEFLENAQVRYRDLAYLGDRQVDYPDIAVNLAREVRDGTYDRGILICGTGQGMAMCANKVNGVYAGACNDVYSAERLRKSNNAQIIALGALLTGPQAAISIIDAWLHSEFQGGGSKPKVDRMRQLEESLSLCV